MVRLPSEVCFLMNLPARWDRTFSFALATLGYFLHGLTPALHAAFSILVDQGYVWELAFGGSEAPIEVCACSFPSHPTYFLPHPPRLLKHRFIEQVYKLLLLPVLPLSPHRLHPRHANASTLHAAVGTLEEFPGAAERVGRGRDGGIVVLLEFVAEGHFGRKVRVVNWLGDFGVFGVEFLSWML